MEEKEKTSMQVRQEYAQLSMANGDMMYTIKRLKMKIRDNQEKMIELDEQMIKFVAKEKEAALVSAQTQQGADTPEQDATASEVLPDGTV